MYIEKQIEDAFKNTVEKFNNMNMCCCCGYIPEDDRNLDCYYYFEDHDMGATIPFCRHNGKIIENGTCGNCEYYLSKKEADKIICEHVKGRN